MSIQVVSVDVGLTDEQKALEGPLDPDQVFFQYLCTTIDGGHDPNGTPDDHVRPAHAALHGAIFRLDDPTAPVPPIDFGCRCAMRYVGGQATLAARVFNAEAETEPVTRAEAYATWIRANVPEWQAIADAAAAATVPERLAVAWEAARAAKVPNPTDIARMVVEALAAGAIAATGAK